MKVSIHAPHVGSDHCGCNPAIVRKVSIHAPHVGSDSLLEWLMMAGMRFNPRSPRGERLFRYKKKVEFIKFQSTLPTWGATVRQPVLVILLVVSIHAPHVGSDVPCGHCEQCKDSFNPRSPRGERLNFIIINLPFKIVSIHAPHVGSDCMCNNYL